MDVIDLPADGVLGFTRGSANDEQIAVVANLTDRPRSVPAESVPWETRYDLIAQERIWKAQPIALRPFQVRWIVRD